MVKVATVALLAAFAAVSAVTGFKMLREIAEFGRWQARREADITQVDALIPRSPDGAA